MSPSPEDETPNEAEGPTACPWRFQFGMRSLLGTMLLLCVPFAIWGGLLRAGKQADGQLKEILFILLCVASPVAMMILVSLVPPALKLWRQFQGSGFRVQAELRDGMPTPGPQSEKRSGSASRRDAEP